MGGKKREPSKGEVCCRDLLLQLNLIGVPEYRIPQLPKYRYDYFFVYQNKKYLLEFDGIQHFEYTPYFHSGRKTFKKAQKRDFLKTVVGMMNGYTIIRIAYPDLSQGKEIITRALISNSRFIVSSEDKYRYLSECKIPMSWLKKYDPSHLILPTLIESKRVCKD